MNRPLKRLAEAASGWPAVALQVSTVFLPAVFVLIFSTAVAVAQETRVGPPSVRSVSGQFVVAAVPGESPFLHRADLAADTNLIRLEPALLTVSVERFKFALWTRLGLRPGGDWSGKIYLTLYPARSLNDEVNIQIIPAPGAWSYRVQLPDVVTRTRFARAMTAVMLLEIANRDNRDTTRSVELPAWLTDGLSRQILGSDEAKVMLSLPARKTEGLSESRVDKKERGVDPLAEARRTLQNLPALTFDELCWPTDAQMNGTDGGAYLASAQLFVDSLIGLENGADKLRVLLGRLPGCLNWQTAFYAAFHEHFKRPLEVEKWWCLRVIRFAARDPGPRWNVTASRERLTDLLAVPVEYRNAQDALPEHTVVSLQNAIRNFRTAQLTAILEIKRRDFELAQFRMAQPLTALTDGYRAAITDFLGEGGTKSGAGASGKNTVVGRKGLSVAETVKRLDALDARRRDVEARLDATAPPKTLNLPNSSQAISTALPPVQPAFPTSTPVAR